MPFDHGAWSYQARRALLAQIVPVYQTASRAKKHLILNAFVRATGYARPTAIRLLNHPPADAPAIRRARGLRYGPEVQQALGGSQVQLFTGLPAGYKIEFKDYSGPNGTGTLLKVYYQ